MATVGTIAISMVANTELWTAGLNKGAKALEGFAKSTATHLKAVPGLAADLFKGLATGAVAAGGALVALTAVQANSIDKTGDMADRLGTTTAALSELRYAAKLTGSEIEDLDPALAKMNQLLGDAARQGGPTADALEKLGLDARVLAQMDPTQAFSMIAGAFEKIPTAAEKASFAMDIFGKGGVRLLNTLSAGPGELARFSEEFRKFGGSVSEAQRQGVGSMFDSLDRLTALIEGIGIQLSVQLAPFITAAADQLLEMGTAGESMGLKITNALEAIVTGIAVAVDKFQSFVKDLSWIGKGFQKVSTDLQFDRNLPGGQFQAMFNQLKGPGGALDLEKAAGGPKNWGAEVTRVFDEIRDKASKAGGAMNNAAKGMRGLGSEFIATAKAVKDLEISLQGQIDALLRGTKETEIYKLSQAGATDAQLANARTLSKQLEGYTEAKSIFDATRTPLEKFQKELAKLDDLKERGHLKDETYARAKALAQKELEGDSMTKRSAALEAGSAGAYSAVLDYQGSQTKDASAKETANATKATAKGVTEGNKLATQTLQALQGIAANLSGQALQAFRIGG